MEDSQILDTLREAKAKAMETNGPVLVEVAVGPYELVLPMIKGGASFEDIIL